MTPELDSWVEISSQPSSSSLSSIGDEIITTGLRVGPSSSATAPVRRRRLHQHPQALHRQPTGHAATRAPPAASPAATTPAETSSQEEYDETESEEDRVIAVSSKFLSQPVASDADAEPDSGWGGGDDATALGPSVANASVFRPQPNAFSHPPAQSRSLPAAGHTQTPFDRHHHHDGFRSRRTSAGSRFQRRSNPGVAGNNLSPLYREDNDAALRASLTTLLSCAAAARGLSKTNEQGSTAAAAGGSGPAQPMDLRLVPESELPDDGDDPAAPAPSPVPVPAAARSRAPAPSGKSPAPEKGKRSAAAAAASSTRAAKRKRTAFQEVLVSPTVLTWVVSASVFVIVSVVGFGAGYVIGREVGRQEAFATGAGMNTSTVATAAAGGTTSCGREVMVRGGGAGLRHLRWGGTVVAGSAAA